MDPVAFGGFLGLDSSPRPISWLDAGILVAARPVCHISEQTELQFEYSELSRASSEGAGDGT